jgi:exosortase A
MQVVTAARPPHSRHAISNAWLRHGAALAILVLLTLIAFRDCLSAAITVWVVSPTYSHCFLIVPIVIWLLWEKRAALGALTPSLFPKALLLTPLFALVWWMGQLAAINEVQQYAVVAIIQSLMVALLGINVIRVIWFPVLYLLFLVPTGEYLIAPMQSFAAHFVDVSLNILGIPHYTEGTRFELTSGRYEIAEACAGLRFLIATVTLGVLFSYMMFRKLYKTVLFLLACVAVPLFGNGLRCVGIIVLAYSTSNEYGAGADHIVYGWGFNVTILLVLGLAGYFFRDEINDKDDIRPARAASPKNLALVSALAAILVGTGPALAWWHDNIFAGPDLTAITQPLHASSWHSGPATARWRPSFFGADAQAAAAIVPAGNMAATPVDYFVGYYARSRPGHAMTAHVNQFWEDRDWVLSGTGGVSATLAGKRVQFQELVITSLGERRLIWSSYWVDGRFTTSLFKVKILQAVAALRGHQGQAAIAFSTPIDGTIEDARLRLMETLPAWDELPARLNQANNQIPTPPLAEGTR